MKRTIVNANTVLSSQSGVLKRYRKGILYKRVKVFNGKLYCKRDFTKKIAYNLGHVSDLPIQKLIF